MFRSVSGAVVMVTIAPLISPYTILGGPGCLAPGCPHFLKTWFWSNWLSPVPAVCCELWRSSGICWAVILLYQMRGGAALGSARNGQTDRHQPISSILSCPLGPVMNVDDTFINNNNMQRGGSQILYFFKSILTTPDGQTNRLTNKDLQVWFSDNKV